MCDGRRRVVSCRHHGVRLAQLCISDYALAFSLLCFKNFLWTALVTRQPRCLDDWAIVARTDRSLLSR